ncbi:MAG: Spy/CpxP family protein refolding chaperone [Desulfobacterales bacterium]|nr:Spy/CpxP family protein refolding chaperone [Desulfobacterales bacterium]
MKKKGMIGIIISVTAVVIALVGCGHQKFWSHEDSPEARAAWVVKKVSDRLDLNPRQQEELNRISKEVMARRDDIRTSREQSRQQVLDMVRSDAINRAELERLVNEKKAQIEELIPFFMDKALAFHAMLTPEQRETLAAEMEKHHSRGHGCWSRWSASK